MVKKILTIVLVTVLLGLLIVPTLMIGFYETKLANDTYQTINLKDINTDEIIASATDSKYLYIKTDSGMYKTKLETSSHLIPQLEMENKMKGNVKDINGIGSSIMSVLGIVLQVFLLSVLFSVIKFIFDVKKGIKTIKNAQFPGAKSNKFDRESKDKKDSNQDRSVDNEKGNDEINEDFFEQRGFGGMNPFAKENNFKISTVIPKVSIDDVAGIDTIKDDVMSLIDSLKNPGAYKAIGAKISKGIILYGSPGTGKTLLAKAIAGTAGVPFLSVSGADFIEKYVGVGASRVRSLYNIAKRKAPCIVFIDEIDAIGGERSNDSNGERDQTLNALLTELDGFDGTEGVLTICATNRLDMLDPALIRAGRFDLKLAVPNPDLKARLAILNKHAEGKNFSLSVDMNVVAKKTAGFSGAELATLLNSAALNAVKLGRQVILMEDIEEAFFKIVMNGSKKANDNLETLKLVAWHEAGHALATKLLTDDGVSSVTIIGSTSGAGGVTFRQPKEGVIYSRKYLLNTVKCMYAGRAAEKILLNDDDEITIGASQDIHAASQIIKDYLSKYGFGNSSLLDLSVFSKDVNVIDEASKLATDCYNEVYNLLLENEDLLSAIAGALLEKESIDEDVLDSIINKKKSKNIDVLV